MCDHRRLYHEEVNRRIAIGKETFSKRGELLRGRCVLCLFRQAVVARGRQNATMIWIGTRYCMRRWEKWTFNDSFEMWIWRKLMKISWTEHRSNQHVLDMVDENRSSMNTIRQKQNKNLAIANRSRVSCTHNMSMASMITPWPWNLG